MSELGNSFIDVNARNFDDRAGVTDQRANEISRNILSHLPKQNHISILDIGAGTGEIGAYLCGQDRTYTCLEESKDMIAAFAKRASTLGLEHCTFLQGDANTTWPFPDQSKDVVFGSRVFHLLDPVHVVHETLRVLTPTIGTFVMGKVKRDKQSPKDRFRTKMRELLIEYGAQPRPSEKRRAGILDQLEKAGMHTLATQTIYSWETTHRPIDSISNWAQKDTMGGILPPQAVKEKVLTSLRQWALDVYGDLDKDVPTQEHYILEMATFDKQ